MFCRVLGHDVPGDSEAVKGIKITVGPPFFNKVNVPIAIFLMFLTESDRCSHGASVDKQLEAEFPLAGHHCFGCGSSTVFPRRASLLCMVVSSDVDLRRDHDRP
jgi:hypothetical protein